MDAKICPLIMAAQSGRCIDRRCLGDSCAWYYGDRCAILELAMNTGDIQNVADMIDYRGGGGA